MCGGSVFRVRVLMLYWVCKICLGGILCWILKFHTASESLSSALGLVAPCLIVETVMMTGRGYGKGIANTGPRDLRATVSFFIICDGTKAVL